MSCCQQHRNEERDLQCLWLLDQWFGKSGRLNLAFKSTRMCLILTASTEVDVRVFRGNRRFLCIPQVSL